MADLNRAGKLLFALNLGVPRPTAVAAGRALRLYCVLACRAELPKRGIPACGRQALFPHANFRFLNGYQPRTKTSVL